MKGVVAVFVCLLALQAHRGAEARFLLDIRSLPLHGRHLTLDARGSDPIGADTRGSDPIGSSGRSAASAQPFASQAPAVAIAEAPAYAASSQTKQASAAEAQPTATSMGTQAQSQGAAPTTAPAGESAPAVPTLQSQLGRRLAEDAVGSDPKGADTRGADPAGSPSVFRQAVAAPVSAQSSAGGQVPLSTILYNQVPQPGKPTLAAAPTTAPGGAEAPTSAE